MRGMTLLLIALLPALAALGHDLYLFYDNYGIDNIQGDAQQQVEDKGAFSFFASLGFIWTRYSPETYKMAAENMNEQSWALLSRFLTHKAVAVALALAGFIMMMAFLLRLLGVGGEGGGSKQMDSHELPFHSRNKRGHMKYKRK